MDQKFIAREARRQQRLERLGTNEPLCAMCGEADDRALEKHHVAGRKHDNGTVILCRNCHRGVTDDQKDHPPVDLTADPALDGISRFLRGLADMLRYIVEKLYVFADLLAQRAAPMVEGDAR